MVFSRTLEKIFRPQSGAFAFFTSILIWGVGLGCYNASLNNYFVDIYSVTEFQRGWIEFYRELPGLLLVFILAIFHRVSDWRIMRWGTLFSIAAILLLLIRCNLVYMTILIFVWSLGEHLVIPARQSLAMEVARPQCSGVSLGLLACVLNAGAIVGSLVVALIFWLGLTYWPSISSAALYSCVWLMVAFLLIASLLSTFTKNAPNKPSKRPKLFFRRKYKKYYYLELFYGGRKQIFYTFAPFVLIKIYGMTTSQVALLMCVSAICNMFGGPLIGKITDKLGYRSVMIFDTMILFFVCMAYGFANQLFLPSWALGIVCVNYLLDGILSTASLANNIYLKEISANNDELTSSMSTGMSINHLVSLAFAAFGGWIWTVYGVGALFSLAAVMALGNSMIALSLPKTLPSRR